MGLNEGYDRINAKKYAELYALAPNVQDYPYYKDNDCTNFISQVLKAGGIKMQGTKWDDFNSWFCNTNNYKELNKVSITWRAARYFLRHWGNENGMGKNNSYNFHVLTPEEFIFNFSIVYNMLEVGDVVQYGDPLPYHSQVVHNKLFNPSIGRYDLFMAQHTSNRLNVSIYDYVTKLLNVKNTCIYLYKITAQ